MLVLSRQENESIVINHNIVVTVIEIRGKKVRLGVKAPKEIAVHRDEIEEKITGGTPMTVLTPAVPLEDLPFNPQVES